MEANEKKCPQCAEMVRAEARVCRFCNHSFENDVSSISGGAQLPSKTKKQARGCLIALGVLIALALIGTIAGLGQKTVPAPSTVKSGNVGTATNVASGATPTAIESTSTVDVPEKVPSIGLFGAQANAARSAQQYLDMTGFSRRGLIAQLSSDAGDGYSIGDATAAVDSLTVDWNDQATRSAKEYLDMTGFSCSGLIEQLSSDAGSKYTKAQARYGAQQAGAC